MSQLTESIAYSSPVEHTQTKSGLSVALAYAVSTMTELLASINSGVPGGSTYVQRAAGIEFPAADHGGRFHRATLMMAGRGAENTVIEETLYLVKPSDLRAQYGVEAPVKKGVELHKVADLAWTLGTGTISTDVGGRTDHKHADEVTVTPTGLLLAETRVEISGVNWTNGVAIAPVYDIGSSIGLIRLIGLPGSSPATAGVGRHQRWK